MSTPTLYLSCLILASTAYPSGFSYSLYRLTRGAPREVSTAFLCFLVLPFLLVVPAAWAVSPGLFFWHRPGVPLLAVAALLAPAALLVEYGAHAIVSYRTHGTFPRRLTLQQFWQRGLRPADQLLLMLVVVGEEIFYRVLWLGILHRSFEVSWAAALCISSVAYGLNHLAFGATSVVSKTLVGLLYGGLYLLGGESLWLPVVAHGLQNILLLRLGKGSNA